MLAEAPRYSHPSMVDKKNINILKTKIPRSTSFNGAGTLTSVLTWADDRTAKVKLGRFKTLSETKKNSQLTILGRSNTRIAVSIRCNAAQVLNVMHFLHKQSRKHFFKVFSGRPVSFLTFLHTDASGLHPYTFRCLLSEADWTTGHPVDALTGCTGRQSSLERIL